MSHTSAAIKAMSRRDQIRMAELLAKAETPLLRAVGRDIHAAIAREDAEFAVMQIEYTREQIAETQKLAAELPPLPQYEEG